MNLYQFLEIIIHLSEFLHDVLYEIMNAIYNRLCCHMFLNVTKMKVNFITFSAA